MKIKPPESGDSGGFFFSRRLSPCNLVSMSPLQFRWLSALALARRWARSNVLAHVAAAIVVGALAGASVTIMTRLAEAAHVAFYGIPFDERLSAQAKVSPLAAFLTLGSAGLAMGLFETWRRRLKAAPSVDPVEANALLGGRLPFVGSLVVVAQTLVSNGAGASVGLESGYAQIGSAVASRVGLALRLRRADQRMLLGCGAAGAMAAAFGAPLTGAFYAFELVIGVYSLANAGPVIAAAVAGALTVKMLGGAPYYVSAPAVASLGVEQHIALVGLGLVAAALGVATMRASAGFERLFKASRLPIWVRPVVGGFVVAAIASFTPQALGAGHGALVLDTPRALGALTLAALIVLKLAACLISLASGFRGGLFFASMFVGALLGKFYGLALLAAAPGLAFDQTAFMFAGMATLGVAVIGAPLAMTFLVLESSGDLPLASGVLGAVIAASLAVRLTFGYSFSSWKFHLRGEDIRGALDVGWVRDLTAARLMDRHPAVASATMQVGEFCAAHPLASAHYVALRDGDGRYAGLVPLAEAHAAGGAPTRPVAGLALFVTPTLSPDMDAKSALAVFEAAQSEILAVTDADGALLGTLGEARVARRLADALDVAARDTLDES